MSIQFDWHFDENDEKQKNGAINANQFSRGVDSPAHRFRPVVLTASQRRLHAALARIRPWLCPDTQPEWVAHSFGPWQETDDIIRSLWMIRCLMRVWAHMRYRPHEVILTARQRRLHAALARIRPWSCPEALRE